MQSGEKRSERPDPQNRTAHPIKTTQTTNFFSAGLSMDILVRITGLEPARRRHQILSLARLPIPPYPHDQHHGTIRRTFHRIKKEPSPGSFLSERAGIRTPDNLIKSQVLYHLSYTPIFLLPAFPCKTNWASWIRTSECRSQSPVPYRLAMAHEFSALFSA